MIKALPNPRHRPFEQSLFLFSGIKEERGVFFSVEIDSLVKLAQI